MNLDNFNEFSAFLSSSIGNVLTSECKKISAELITDNEEKEGYAIIIDGRPLGIVKVIAQIMLQVAKQSDIPSAILLGMLVNTVSFYEQHEEASETKDITKAKEELRTLNDILSKGE